MINIKRIVCILAVVVLLFTGCGAKPAKVSIDAVSLADTLSQNIAFEDSMSVLEQEIMLDIFGIDGALVKNQKVYVSTGATAEEIAVFESHDKESANEIYKALSKRIEDQKLAFENYVPKELAKLSDAVLQQRENYIILCISNDSQTAKSIIEDHIQ